MRQKTVTVTIVYANQIEFSNDRSNGVGYPNSEDKITFIITTELTLKEPPRLGLMTMEEIESENDPKENNGAYKDN